MSEKVLRRRRFAGMALKVWIFLLLEFAIFAVALFGAAGTLDWPAGWTFMALFAVSVTAMSLGLAKHDPVLLEERMRFLPQGDQPLWDRAVMAVLTVLCLSWLILPGLDAVRFGWSHMPAWLQISGGIVVPASLGAAYVVMCQNTYLAPTVRKQDNRGHKVISTGAYAVVRHPFYAVLIPFFSGTSLLLGSWWSLGLSAPIALLLAYRSVREERFLERELEGYGDYMKRVRYRLIPYLW